MPDLIKRIKIASNSFFTGTNHTHFRVEIPHISDEEIKEAKEFFPAEKFFIFGHARSGTTVLARLIRLHSDVHCNYQAHFFTRMPLLTSLVDDSRVGDWLARRSNRWNRGHDLSPVVLRSVSDFILEREARRLGKSIVGDKSPNNLMNGESVHLMHKIYPDASLIFIVRDGRDTILSHRLQAFIDFPQRLSKEDQKIREKYIRDPEPFLNGERSMFSDESIKSAAKVWVKNVTETSQIGSDLFGDLYTTIRFEDLLAQPWDVISELWGFLNANHPTSDLKELVEKELKDNPDARWQQEKAGDISIPTTKGTSGKWKEVFTPKDKEVFLEIAGSTLKSWGYELDG